MTEPETAGEGAPTGAPVHPDAIVTDPATGETFALDIKTSPSWWLDDPRKCSGCGHLRARCIVRLNLPGQPLLCDPCFDERMTR